MFKRLFLTIAAIATIATPVFAANSATVQTALPIRVNGLGPVYPYVVAFDTTSSDLTIRTPSSGNMVCIVGMQMSETNAANLIFTSGSTQLLTLELAANQGVYDPIDEGASFCTQPSEALKIQTSAAITNMLLYVIEAKYLNVQ